MKVLITGGAGFVGSHAAEFYASRGEEVIVFDNLSRAKLLGYEKLNANYEVFNVGTGNAISILELANTLIKLYEGNIKPEITNKYRAGDIRHYFADISKIKSKLGYEPKISFEEGMKGLVEWGKREKAEDKFDKAYEELKERGLTL